MKRTLRASRQACLAVLVCVGSTACVTALEDIEGVSGARLFESALDPDMVGGAVKDYTGDGVPDLLMVVRTDAAAAAAMLTGDPAMPANGSGGGFVLIVRILDNTEAATPKVALSGQATWGTAEELIARFEGLRNVLDGLPPKVREGLRFGDQEESAKRSLADCSGRRLCGWRDRYYGGDYWWVPERYAVCNLGNWDFNDQTGSVANFKNWNNRLSDNCCGCEPGSWVGIDSGNTYEDLGRWGIYKRVSAVYIPYGEDRYGRCWDTNGFCPPF